MIETQHLILRRFTLDDAPGFFPLVSHPEVIRFTGETAQTSLDAVRETLRSRPLHDYATRGYGRMAVIEKSSGLLIGFSGLKYLDVFNAVDIGYRFIPEAWGKGYATESAQALMHDGVKTHGLSRIIGMVMPENRASARVLQKLGLTYERTSPYPETDLILDFYTIRMASGK